MTDCWIYDVKEIRRFFSFHSIWCLDDNLSIMYELESLDAAAAKKQTRMAEQSVAVNLSATRRLQRVSTTFEKVMIKIQRETLVRTNAVAMVGLLRDAGHGVCKLIFGTMTRLRFTKLCF